MESNWHSVTADHFGVFLCKNTNFQTNSLPLYKSASVLLTKMTAEKLSVLKKFLKFLFEKSVPEFSSFRDDFVERTLCACKPGNFTRATLNTTLNNFNRTIGVFAAFFATKNCYSQEKLKPKCKIKIPCRVKFFFHVL